MSPPSCKACFAENMLQYTSADQTNINKAAEHLRQEKLIFHPQKATGLWGLPEWHNRIIYLFISAAGEATSWSQVG